MNYYLPSSDINYVYGFLPFNPLRIGQCSFVIGGKIRCTNSHDSIAGITTAGLRSKFTFHWVLVLSQEGGSPPDVGLPFPYPLVFRGFGLRL